MSGISGRIWRFDQPIDTDVLAPGRWMKAPIEELSKHCLADLRPEFASGVRPGDVLVGSAGFGMGSSREQAPQALKHLGIDAVIAPSFARIFFRNAINLGLPVMVCADTQRLVDGALAGIDLATGQVHDAGGLLLAQTDPLPEFLREIVAAGGLIPHLRAKRA